MEDPSGDRNKFMQDIFKLITDYCNEDDESTPVVRLQSPEDLASKIDMLVTDGPRSYDDLVQSCKTILEYSVKTGHPHFHNQLFAGTKPAALAGEMVTAASNVSMYTYEVAPVFTCLENVIFAKMRALMGWGDVGGDGIFCPGGSLSNFYGMNLARWKKCHDLGINIKEEGMHAAPPLVAFICEQGHYSITKAAAFLGIGTKNVIKVAADNQGRIVLSDLEAKIEASVADGKTPFFIQATAATTVLGGYDDFDGVCTIAQKHGIWVHIDGAWGASVVLSPTHRHLLNGSSRVDSIAWNPHKMMGIPLQCAAFITKHTDMLMAAHSSNAKYLFQEDKLNAALDSGDKAVQCGRKVDILKLWMTWVATGDAGYVRHIDNFMAVARYLHDQVVARAPEFKPVAEPMCSNVCFWFVPPSLRADGAPAENSPEWREVVHKAAATIKARMQEKGSMMIGFQSIPLCDDPTPPNFFRMVVMSEKAKNADMDFLLNEIATLGADL